MMSAPTAPETPLAPTDERVTVLTYKPHTIYRVQIAFGNDLTFWTPFDCVGVTLGNPQHFALRAMASAPRLFVLSALQSVPANPTTVNFICGQEGQYSFVVYAEQVSQQTSADLPLGFRFDFDPSDHPDLIAAEQKGYNTRNAECAAEKEALSATVASATEAGFILGGIENFAFSDIAEYGRDQSVVVKAYRLLTLGTRTILYFFVQNGTSNDLGVLNAEVFEQETEAPLDSARVVMVDRNVPAGKHAKAAVLFDNPMDIETFVLVVSLDGPREIRVEDIAF